MKKNLINNFGLVLKEPYSIINLSFAGVILLIFFYSGIFSADKNNHPIKSACANIEGQACKSEGLSRSFSEIVRLNFKSAKSYNKYGIRIFSFFLVQLFLRIAFSFLLHNKVIIRKNLIIMDTIVSILLYVYCFWGLIF